MGACASKGLLRRRRRRRKEPESDEEDDPDSLFDIYQDGIRTDDHGLSPYVVRIVALFTFAGQSPDDLSFTAGDRMVVSEDEWLMRDVNWVRAVNLRTRDSGLIPKNYVRPLRGELPNDSIRGRGEMSILDRLWHQVQQNCSSQVVCVHRSRAVTDLLQYFARPGFTLRKRVHVVFDGEEGVDQGGLTRDLGSSILEHLQHSQVFEGPAGGMCLSHSLGALSRQEYLRAGQLVGFVLCHASMACPLFSDTLFNLLCGGPDEGAAANHPGSQSQYHHQPQSLSVSQSSAEREMDSVARQQCVVKVQDVPDLLFRQRLEEIESSDFPCPLAEEMAEEIGYYDPLNVNKKEAFVNAACQYYLYHRCRSEIEQFKAGLNQLGILKVLQEHKDEARKVLAGSHVVALTAESLFQLFSIIWDSAPESAERQEEEVMCFEFQFFLQECASGDCEYSLSDVLHFVTGTRAIPPGGFRSRPTLSFAREPYPRVSTCILDLTLPLSLPPQRTLKDVMVLALSSPEFGVP